MRIANGTRQLLITSVDYDIRQEVDDTVRERLGDGPYKFYFKRIRWKLQNRCLTLRGAVPTFYLKQVLQTRLNDIPGVDRLVNDVDVISSCGLSSLSK